MLVVVFGSSFFAYNLQAYSSDPLSAFGESTAINKDFLIQKMIRDLQLDVPPPIRYFSWLRGIISGLWGDLDLGMSTINIPVSEIIAQAIPVTVRLVIASTFLAIILGVTVGMITAIWQCFSKNSWRFSSMTFWQNPQFRPK